MVVLLPSPYKRVLEETARCNYHASLAPWNIYSKLSFLDNKLAVFLFNATISLVFGACRITDESQFFRAFKENKSYPLRGRCRAVKRAYSRHPYALPRNKLNGTNCVPEEREKERKEETYFLLQYCRYH